MRMIGYLMFGLAVLAAVPAVADEVRRATVHFSSGSSGSTTTSKLKGYQSVEYSVG